MPHREDSRGSSGAVAARSKGRDNDAQGRERSQSSVGANFRRTRCLPLARAQPLHLSSPGGDLGAHAGEGGSSAGAAADRDRNGGGRSSVPRSAHRRAESARIAGNGLGSGGRTNRRLSRRKPHENRVYGGPARPRLWRRLPGGHRAGGGSGQHHIRGRLSHLEQVSGLRNRSGGDRVRTPARAPTVGAGE